MVPPTDLSVDGILALFRDLVTRCIGIGVPPALGEVNALGWTHRPSTFTWGTWHLESMPPLLYLDAEQVEQRGGRAHVLATPCRVEPVEGGGLIVASRERFWGPPDDDDRVRVAAVERHLNVAPLPSDIVEWCERCDRPLDDCRCRELRHEPGKLPWME